MTLGELIAALEAADPRLVLPEGFSNPHSWRGDYSELAFEPAAYVTVDSMLDAARSALGTTYGGYKGGDYEMTADTDCWIAAWGSSVDSETIGPRLLRLMLAAGVLPEDMPTPDNWPPLPGDLWRMTPHKGGPLAEDDDIAKGVFFARMTMGPFNEQPGDTDLFLVLVHSVAQLVDTEPEELLKMGDWTLVRREQQEGA